MPNGRMLRLPETLSGQLFRRPDLPFQARKMTVLKLEHAVSESRCHTTVKVLEKFYRTVLWTRNRTRSTGIRSIYILKVVLIGLGAASAATCTHMQGRPSRTSFHPDRELPRTARQALLLCSMCSPRIKSAPSACGARVGSS
jgi:hypothetical protein